MSYSSFSQQDDFKMEVSVVIFTMWEENKKEEVITWFLITCSCCSSSVWRTHTFRQADTHSFPALLPTVVLLVSLQRSAIFGWRLLCLPVWKYTHLILRSSCVLFSIHVSRLHLNWWQNRPSYYHRRIHELILCYCLKHHISVLWSIKNLFGSLVLFWHQETIK